MFFLLCMHTTCKHVIPICIPVSHKCIQMHFFTFAFQGSGQKKSSRGLGLGFLRPLRQQQNAPSNGLRLPRPPREFAFLWRLPAACWGAALRLNKWRHVLSIHPSMYRSTQFRHIPSIYALVKSPLMSSTACVMIALHPYICPGGYPIDDVRKSLLKSRHQNFSTATIIKTNECGYIVMYHRC